MAAHGRKQRLDSPTSAWGLLASIALHLAGYAVLTSVGAVPVIDIELSIPSEIELGFFDAQPVPPPAAAQPPAQPVVPAEPSAPAQEAPSPVATPDAGAPPPEPSRDAGAPAGTDAGPRSPTDAGTGPSAPDAGTPLLASYGPEGAQLALRLDLARLRDSQLAREAKRLLEVIPDWRMVLDGSGLDPLVDLERIFIASPDLTRASMVVAGEYAREGLARIAVANLAQARGVEAVWRREGGFDVAPWANADDTVRVVALLGERQFVITRPEDLPRVLAIAARLQARLADAGIASDTGDALLALGPEEIVVFTAEGARAYAAAGQKEMIPLRLRVAVRIAADTEPAIKITFQASYEDEQTSARAQDFWDGLRKRFASHPLLAITGMSRPLSGAEIVRTDAELGTEVELTTSQARRLLGFVAGLLAPPPPPPAIPTAKQRGSQPPVLPRPGR